MIPHIEGSGPSQRGVSAASKGHPVVTEAPRGRVLVIEDEEVIRDSMGPLLEQEGYQVFFAENGRDALRQLHAEPLPDVIVLDLRMPVMDGWEFRTIQKDDPKLGRIPVVAISADGSAQAAAISAQAYLRKPVAGRDLLTAVERVLTESKRHVIERVDETERLASLGRLAAGVGHEINNPLTFMMLNLNQAIGTLKPPVPDGAASLKAPRLEVEVVDLKARIASVAELLEDSRLGAERIRVTVSNLQRLSRKANDLRGPLDIHMLIEQSVSMVWNQIRHRARLIKTLGVVPKIRGNDATLGQVFLNLLVNAAQAMPEGDAEHNEIRISTKVVPGVHGDEVLVEVSDSGKGIASQDISHVFEPFFTTKPTGEGTGLGLSISRQTVSDHGGRIVVNSQVGTGTVFRVYLPVGEVLEAPRSAAPPVSYVGPLDRGRLLVIDDEPLIGRIIRTALNNEHDVIVVQRAADAVSLLEHGDIFDLMLCDVLMPDISGPAFYATLLERWPLLVPRLVFMTGGAFTPGTVEFIDRVPTRVLSKPFKIELLKRLVRERMRGNA